MGKDSKQEATQSLTATDSLVTVTRSDQVTVTPEISPRRERIKAEASGIRDVNNNIGRRQKYSDGAECCFCSS